MYSATVVANAILKAAKRQGKHVDPLKLIKLTYICQGWSLALREKPLFSESVEAWRYGPVIPSLYAKVSKYGREAINDQLPLGMWFSGAKELSDTDQEFVDKVVEKYGHLHGVALSNLTHQPGTPWANLYKPDKNVTIPKEKISEHYYKIASERKEGE